MSDNLDPLKETGRLPASSTPRFYRGDLPPRPTDLERVKRALGRGPTGRLELARRTGLTQSQVLCAIDALIAGGEVHYDAVTKTFATAAHVGPERRPLGPDG